jgi:hypothetical protein
MEIRMHRRGVVCALAAVACLAAAPARAQQPAAAPATVQAALAADVQNLSSKFTGLARVMAGKYDWRPMDGVRSVADVFNLIVSENRMLTGLLSGAPAQGRTGGMGRGAQAITDPAAMQEALTSSYEALGKAIAGLSEADLNANIRMFGREMTKQGAALTLLFDQHEHLGQSIAYARTNRVVPPWSK